MVVIARPAKQAVAISKQQTVSLSKLKVLNIIFKGFGYAFAVKTEHVK